MACFSAPLVEAIAVSAAGETNGTGPFARRIGWLKKMLYGGSLLLAVEHVWHGEITWRFPFLTAVRDGDIAGMLHEIATVGVAMAVLVTAVWAIMVAVAVAVERRKAARASAEA